MDKKWAQSIIQAGGKKYTIYRIARIEEEGIARISRLPFSIRILVENLLRKVDGGTVTWDDLVDLAQWKRRYDSPREIAYYPSRVVLQDFTGVPCVVDLAAMRDAVVKTGADPKRINPLVPVDLVIDHSVQVDHFGTPDSIRRNMEIENSRNAERYTLLKWAQKAFQNMKIFPPGSGIVHQVNLEFLSRVVMTDEADGDVVAFPDTLVGTDSHTTMINGLGVLGWGVGGIEAEAVMLGQPYYMTIPEVVGVRLTGELPEGSTATDLVLTVTEILRKQGVVGKFVEFYGPGVKAMSLPERATLANMAPEYGATMGFFPVDEETLSYLALTNRGDVLDLVETYMKEQGLFYYGGEEPEYTERVELDMSRVEPSLAGPSRPQDRISLNGMKGKFNELVGLHHHEEVNSGSLSTFGDESGHEDEDTERAPKQRHASRKVTVKGEEVELSHGTVVIAAITSCTNTSNPSVMIGAGLLAKKAVAKGLFTKPCVKTSLAPGSGVVLEYLRKSGLLVPLEKLGFFTVGLGCTTCIGNSGPLNEEIENTIAEHGLVVASVLSGNRNFEARIHQSVKANYLASPALVVAFAIAGRVDIDVTKEPLGTGIDGDPVFLSEIWPSESEIREIMKSVLAPELFEEKYRSITEGDDHWQSLTAPGGESFSWDESSTYIKRPPFLDDFESAPYVEGDIENARALLLLGDSVTTDHISPAGSIPVDYPAGRYLLDNKVSPGDFNTYGSRRGNHEVMLRGTFGNVRIKNSLVHPKEGGITLKFPEREEVFTYDAAMKYMNDNVPLIVLAGKEYGTGSSRDWAAKGTHLLGIRAVLAESYERIHRSNLVGMGLLPLQFRDGKNRNDLGLDGSEEFSIHGLQGVYPGKILRVEAVRENGNHTVFEVSTRLDTDIEVEYFKNCGILPYVLRKLLKG
jgi:aconitate hydratase